MAHQLMCELFVIIILLAVLFMLEFNCHLICLSSKLDTERFTHC